MAATLARVGHRLGLDALLEREAERIEQRLAAGSS